MVVCGVIEDVLIEDIRISIPKGHATTIVADLVVRSTDLHRALSQGRIFQLNTHSLLRLKFPRTPGGAAEEERFASDIAKAVAEKAQSFQDRLEAEAEHLKVEVTRLRLANVQLAAENAQLTANNQKLQVDNVRLQGEANGTKLTEEKLDQMLSLLKDRPTVVHTVVQGTQGAKAFLPEDDAPTFIPSQIKPEGVDASRIEVQEHTGESGGVSQASDALKKLRKQTGQ